MSKARGSAQASCRVVASSPGNVTPVFTAGGSYLELDKVNKPECTCLSMFQTEFGSPCFTVVQSIAHP